MTQIELTPRRGVAGIVFVLCLLLGGAGLALDLLRPHAPAFWPAALPGARALIGVGGALVVVAAMYVLRFAFGQRASEEGGRDARRLP